MGHAFNQTVMDSLTRYHRMLGPQRPVGAGHRPRRHRDADRGGAAVAAAGQSRRRPGARELCGPGVGVEAAVGQHHHQPDAAAGDSVSWAHEYFTMDEKLSKVVVETFVRLYEEGLIYAASAW